MKLTRNGTATAVIATPDAPETAPASTTEPETTTEPATACPSTCGTSG